MRITSSGFVSVQGSCIHRHAHALECEFHYFSSAQARFVNGDHSIPVRNSSLVFSYQNDYHSAAAVDNGLLMQFYFVRFVPDREIAGVLESHRSELPWGRCAEIGLQWTDFFEEIRRKSASGDTLMVASAQLKLKAFIMDLVVSQRSTQRMFDCEPVDRVISVMRENINRSLSLEDFASVTGLSRSYLIRVFRRQTGLTPMQYYMRLKMDTARYLLGTSHEPIYMVSQRLGFWDEFHFSKTFRKHTGVSPTAFREANRR